MALRLEIISSQRPKLGARGSIVLGVAGGSIGRALDNDWPLPDANRFLSGHHARIHFRAGHYIVEDTSSNGVFVNDGTKPLGKRGIHRLNAGDILRMGEYRVLVHIDDDDAAAAPEPGAATMASLTVQNVVPLRVPGSQRRRGSDEDLGHVLDLASLLPTQPAGSPAATAKSAPAPEAAPAAPAASAAPAGAVAAPEAASPPPGSMQDRVNRLRAAAKARLDGTSPSLVVQNGLQAFCRGAGIDIEKLPVSSEGQALQLAGRLLREALLGLKEVLRAQQAFDARYGIVEEKPEGPSPVELPIDDYLQQLFSGHEQRRLDAVMRLREQCASAAGHDLALDAALRQALALFVGHLDPARMQGLPPETSWPRFRDLYTSLMRANESQVPPLFVEALAQAYLESRNR